MNHTCLLRVCDCVQKLRVVAKYITEVHRAGRSPHAAASVPHIVEKFALKDDTMFRYVYTCAVPFTLLKVSKVVGSVRHSHHT